MTTGSDMRTIDIGIQGLREGSAVELALFEAGIWPDLDPASGPEGHGLVMGQTGDDGEEHLFVLVPKGATKRQVMAIADKATDPLPTPRSREDDVIEAFAEELGISPEVIKARVRAKRE